MKLAINIPDPSPSGWFAVGLKKDLIPERTYEGILAANPYWYRQTRHGSFEFGGSISDLRVQNGLILAWHHSLHRSAPWTIPVLDESGWSPCHYHRFAFRSYPQEVNENCIDTAHFSVVHGYEEIKTLQDAIFQEHTVSVKYQIKRAKSLFSQLTRALNPNFEVRLHGLGCAHNHIEVPNLNLQVRMFVMSTPTQSGNMILHLGVSVKQAWLKGFMQKFFVHQIARQIIHDIEQDIRIWEHRRYGAPPLLVANDGPIIKFRRWCQQFYNPQSLQAEG